MGIAFVVAVFGIIAVILAVIPGIADDMQFTLLLFLIWALIGALFVVANIWPFGKSRSARHRKSRQAQPRA